ncbi:MAG: hypothetical protein ACQETI_07285 [Halobacteriota archaeon]
MPLSDIAAGITVTAEQRDRGVPTVDDTGEAVEVRLEAHAESLPCDPSDAAVVLEAYAAGGGVGACAREAAVAPMTAAKTLHRCGAVGISPLSPTARDVLRDWLRGDLSRTEALTLTRAEKAEFALATYVETHDAVPELVEAFDAVRSLGRNASVDKRDALGETMSDVEDLR